MDGPGIVMDVALSRDQVDRNGDRGVRQFLIKGNVSLNSNGIERRVKRDWMRFC